MDLQMDNQMALLMAMQKASTIVKPMEPAADGDAETLTLTIEKKTNGSVDGLTDGKSDGWRRRGSYCRR